MPLPDGPGIYMWENLINGKVYVGSTTRGIRRRYREYLWAFPKGKCHNQPLQRAWNKYGKDSFRFRVLQLCRPENCLRLERMWIEIYVAVRFGYNICPDGHSMLGTKRSEKSKRSASRRMKKWYSENGPNLKLIESNKSRIWTSEAIAKKSKAMKALWQNPEWRNRQVRSRTGRKATASTKAKMSAAQKGKVLSLSTKEKMRNSAISRFAKSKTEGTALYKDTVERCRAMAQQAAIIRWKK